MRRLPLRRLFEVVNGGTPTSEPENWDGAIPWATPVDLGRINGGRIGETQRTLTDEGLRTGSSQVPAGSLVVSTRAPIGYVAETTTAMAFNQGCRGLRPRAELDIRYFRYQLRGSAEQLQALGQGSTFIELSTDNLASFGLIAPPLADQRAIADYLDAETARIDSVVAALRARQRLLIEKLGALILTDLSDGWSVRQLRHVARRVKTGGTPPEADNGDCPWYTPASFCDRLALGEPVRLVPSAWLNDGTAVRFGADSTVVVGIGATAGRVAHLDSVGSGNQQITCIEAGPEVLARFVSWQLWARADELRGIAPMTTLPIISNDLIESLVFMCPPRPEQLKMARRWDSAASVTGLANVATNRLVDRIRERRQALITAAVTGQLKIPGVAA